MPPNPLHLIWVAVIFSEILTMLISSGLSLILLGEIFAELLIIGAVSALAVSLSVSWVLIVLMQKIKLINVQQTLLLEEIEKRAEVEKSLLESETKYREIIDLMPLSFFEADTGGSITFMNQFFLSLHVG